MRVCYECHCCYDDAEAYCGDAGHPVLTQSRESDPEIVPAYRLDVMLDSGEIGELYRAHHIASGSRCVIRIMQVDAESGRQFVADALKTAAFFHPGVVDVYDAGSLQTGEVYVVAEDADGETLHDRMEREGVPDLLTTIQVVRHAAEALDALHTHGIFHGAVNPDNIILRTDANKELLVRLKDVDHGSALARTVLSNTIISDSALRPLRYFAPEQCSDEVPSAAADIYSLGIVLHEMLAGEPPFTAAKPVGLIEQHRNQHPPEITIDSFELRMLLTHTLNEALRKQPNLRQRSANLFARQMRHIEQLKTHSSAPPPAVAESRPSISAPVSGTVDEGFADPLPALQEPIYMDDEYTSLEDDAIGPVRVLTVAAAAELVDNNIAEPSLQAEAQPQPKTSIPVILNDAATETRSSGSRLRGFTDKLRSLAPPLPAFGSSNSLQIVESSYRPPDGEKRTVQAHPEAAAIAPRERKKIVWEQPEDDIPSEKDVLNALALEGLPDVSEPPVTMAPAAVRELASEPETFAPVPVNVQSSRKVSDAVKEPEIETSVSGGIIEGEPIRPSRLKKMQKRSRSLGGLDIQEPEPSQETAEKIGICPIHVGIVPSNFLFALPSRIRRARPRRQPAEQAPFLADLAGKTGGRRPRAAVILGGSASLLALAFIGSLLFSDNTPADAQADRADNRPPALQRSLPPAAKVYVDAPVLKAIKQPEKLRREEAEGTQTIDGPSRDTAPSSETVDRERSVSIARVSRPKPVLVSQNLPSPMSTLVISYGNGKITTTVEPYRDNSVDKKRVSVPTKLSGLSRPRVVKDAIFD